jgi:hypothetical protein
LERALLNTGFEPDDERVWRWELNDPDGVRATVKFELLADLDDEPNNATVEFTGCEHLGAANPARNRIRRTRHRDSEDPGE